MPHARINMHESLRPRMAAMSAAILKAMVDGFAMPADDLFQIFTLHQPGELVFSRTFPKGAEREDVIYVEVLASPVYSPEQMNRGLAAIADALAGIGIKRDNLILMVTQANAWLSPAGAARP